MPDLTRTFFESIDRLAVPYQRGQSNSGPAAQIGLDRLHGGGVIIVDEVASQVRFTSRGLSVPARLDVLDWCEEANDAWGVGRFWRGSGRSTNVSLCLWQGAARPEAMNLAFDAILRARMLALNGDLPVAAPVSPPPLSIETLHQWLVALDTAPRAMRDFDGFQLSFHNRGVRLAVALYLDDSGLLHARTELPADWPLPSARTTGERLHALMAMRAAGHVFRAASGRVGFHLGMPVQWYDPDENLVGWMISRLMYAVHERLIPALRCL